MPLNKRRYQFFIFGVSQQGSAQFAVLAIDLSISRAFDGAQQNVLEVKNEVQFAGELPFTLCQIERHAPRYGLIHNDGRGGALDGFVLRTGIVGHRTS